MRKRLITQERERPESEPEEWIDLDAAAEVELTSEEAEFPVESALEAGGGRGWRAADAGEQVVRLVFDEPRRLSRVKLVFEEPDVRRTQEFVLRWAAGVGEPTRDVVRQQWNFHPPDNTLEVEDYRVDLSGVKVLELAIVPDMSGGPSRASLRSLRVG